uniref:Signal peptidase complex catalytic subunit SEC11 n=1 Tax=Bos taurus TaxID=9913 RepID=A0AAA9T6A1_BOVIN
MVRASTVGAHLPASGLDIFGDLRKMNKRQLYYQVLNFAMIVSSALMIWKGLIVLTGSESPIVVVLSGSMEPAFHRGDLLFLTNFREDPIRAGEIVVFKVEGRDIPIVHRVIKVHEKDNGDIKFLTKGDNNEVDDRGLYKEGQNWLEKKDVVGRARGFLPYVGMVTIIMNDYPKFKRPAPAAAKSLQSCPTLCDPIDGSPPGSAIPGILQVLGLLRAGLEEGYSPVGGTGLSSSDLRIWNPYRSLMEMEMATRFSILAWTLHGQRSLAGDSPRGCKSRTRRH